jgi:hypothetical protein
MIIKYTAISSDVIKPENSSSSSVTVAGVGLHKPDPERLPVFR